MLLIKAATLPALSYRLVPELQEIVYAWEIRCLAVMVGFILVYVLLRNRFKRLHLAGTFPHGMVQAIHHAVLCLAIGLIPVWYCWSVLDPIAKVYNLCEVWRIATSRQLVVFAAGCITWSILVGEFIIWVGKLVSLLLRRAGKQKGTQLD